MFMFKTMFTWFVLKLNNESACFPVGKWALGSTSLSALVRSSVLGLSSILPFAVSLGKAPQWPACAEKDTVCVCPDVPENWGPIHLAFRVQWLSGRFITHVMQVLLALLTRMFNKTQWMKSGDLGHIETVPWTQFHFPEPQLLCKAGISDLRSQCGD